MVHKMLCSRFVYPTGAFKQEEALLMKEKIIKTNRELDGFYGSNGWLESFKTTYRIRDATTVISGQVPHKRLAEKGKKRRGGKQSKKRCTVALLLAANDSKACGPIVVWRYKKPRCFKKLKNIYRLLGVFYFANA